MYLFLLTIFIHECGHIFFGYLVGFKNSIINIYPFGGISIFKEDLNTKTNKELFTLLGGITFQLLFLLLILFLYKYSIITNHVYEIIKRINILLISFNFMPIIPLDGGKLINVLFDKIFPYKISNIISIIVSIIFIIIFYLKELSLFALLLTLFLIKCIIIEINILNIKYNKFLFERYINNYKFNKIKNINNKYYFKRDYYHIINNMYESVYLSKLFDRKY